jgi:aminoglycoside phosphotransferase (APT) family kinase protein
MSMDFRNADDITPLPWQQLERYLEAAGHDIEIGDPPRQFAGGMGNLNYLIDLDGKACVLRRPPLGKLPPGANDMAREHRVLSRLWRAFPLAPQSLLYCEDEAVLGAHFLIMEYRDGAAIQGGTWPAQLSDTERHDICALLVASLAGLHAVDPAAVDLAEFGKPEGFLERAIRGWDKRLGLASDGDAPAPSREVADWLAANLPGSGDATLLHNDFKLDNLLLDRNDPTQAVAMIDWDQATRGDPLFDLATLLSYWAEPGDPDCMTIIDQMPTGAPGSMSRGEARDLYADLSGRDLSEFRFHRVLAMFKLAVVFVQLHAQYRRGTVDNPRYAPFADAGWGIMTMAHEVARGRAD